MIENLTEEQINEFVSIQRTVCAEHNCNICNFRKNSNDSCNIKTECEAIIDIAFQEEKSSNDKEIVKKFLNSNLFELYCFIAGLKVGPFRNRVKQALYDNYFGP